MTRKSLQRPRSRPETERAASADAAKKPKPTAPSDRVENGGPTTELNGRRFAKLDDQLRHTQKMEAVGQLAGGIAHDFNTLLTAIFGWLEIASSELAPDHSARGSLRMVEQAARQAMGLCRSLLTFSHQTPIERQRIKLAEVILETVRLLRRLTPASIELRTELAEEEIWIDGDPTQIQQVLMNLAVNARDAMPDGGTIWITLTTRPDADDSAAATQADYSQGAAVLSVRDEGCGLSPSLKERILEPFFTTKSREQGTGLGLSIVHAIVADHGGRLDIESEVGRGSTFTVYLPRKGPAAAAAATTSDGDQPAGINGRLLIVEDSDMVRAMLATVLTDAGHRIREASDGAEALHLLKEHHEPFDLAVVDLDLPKVDGVTVLEKAAKLSPNMRGVVITGYPVSSEVEDRLAKLGCPILNKPFQVHAIKELVARLLTQ